MTNKHDSKTERAVKAAHKEFRNALVGIVCEYMDALTKARGGDDGANLGTIHGAFVELTADTNEVLYSTIRSFSNKGMPETVTPKVRDEFMIDTCAAMVNANISVVLPAVFGKSVGGEILRTLMVDKQRELDDMVNSSSAAETVEKMIERMMRG